MHNPTHGPTYFSARELSEIGFARVGTDVLVSRRASLIEPDRVSIGDRVRIDDFCVLTGSVTIGSNVHISAFCGLFGRASIQIGSFVSLSARVTVFSTDDDYSGQSLANPTIPEEFTGVHKAPVVVGRHVIVGSGSVVLPGVALGTGSAVGALSLVKENLTEWTMYAGVPARRVRDRDRGLLAREAQYLASAGLEAGGTAP